MRTVKTKIYKFSELSKKAKQAAIDANRDINSDYDWWECVYEDAANVGIALSGFDLYRRDIDLSFESDAEDAAKRILEEHGETCDTHKTAEKFLQAIHVKKVAMALVGEDSDDYSYFEEDCNELGNEFKIDIANCYLKMLDEDLEYRESDEAIIETIESNDHEFTHNGEPYHRKRRNIAA